MSNDLYYTAEKERVSKPSLEEEVADLKVLVAKQTAQTAQICSLLEEMVAPIRVERRRQLQAAIDRKEMETGKTPVSLRRELQAIDGLIAASKVK
jgi:hypothetical protein